MAKNPDLGTYNMNYQILDTYKPSTGYNIGLPLGTLKRLAKARAGKKVQKIVAFEEVWDTELNAGGRLSYAQMKSMYENFRKVFTETKFKRVLDKLKITGYKHNMPLYNQYFADFCWKEKKVIIEIDGPFHNATKDNIRDAFLRERGWSVYRLKVPFSRAEAKELVTSIHNVHLKIDNA